MEVKIIKTHTFEIPNRGKMQINELVDGTFHGCGTTHIYTKEQYEAAVTKIIAAGGKEI